MYGKIFESAYSGSMVGAGAMVFSVWGYIIAHTRASDSSVELNPIIMATVIGETVEEIEVAIKKLEQPDPKSRSRENEGRRIIKEGQFLYHVVNFKKYRDIQSEDDRRSYMRKYMKAYRVNKKVNESLPLAKLTQAEAKEKAYAKAEQTTLVTGVTENDEVKALKSQKEPTAEEIFKAYPKRVAKKAALKAIEKVLKDGTICAHDLLETVKAFAKSKAGQAGKFCPHAATWFNQGRFEDDRAEWDRDTNGTSKPANWAGYTSPEQAGDVADLLRRSEPGAAGTVSGCDGSENGSIPY